MNKQGKRPGLPVNQSSGKIVPQEISITSSDKLLAELEKIKMIEVEFIKCSANCDCVPCNQGRCSACTHVQSIAKLYWAQVPSDVLR